MPKKDELRKLVRGRGLEAFRPAAEDVSHSKKTDQQLSETAQPANSILSSEKGTIADTDSIQSTGYVPDKIRPDSHCVLSKFVPTSLQQNAIDMKKNDNEHQIFILDSFIEQAAQTGNLFKKNCLMTFNVLIVATGVVAKLKHHIKIYWKTYDFLRLQVQPLYNFSLRKSLKCSTCRLCYQIMPALSGYFKFSVILDVPQIEMVSFFEGTPFKIH